MRKNIVIMNILVAFFWMSQYCYMPNLPGYAQSLGADALVLGIIGGVYGIAQILLRIPLGMICDNTGKDRGMMVVGTAMLAVSSGILILGDNTGWIILGRLMAGVAAAWWALQSAIYGNYHKDEQQVKAQGILSASSNWGKVAASLIGGLIAEWLGVHAIFIVAFFAAAFCIYLSTRLKNIPRTGQKKPAMSMRELIPLLKNRDMLVLSLFSIIGVLLFFAGPTYFTVIAAQALGATSLDFGLLNMVFYVACGITCLWIGSRTYKKIGNIHAMAIAFAVTGVACMPWFYHISLPVIYLMQAATGIGTGVTCTATAGLVLRIFPKEQRGAASGIFQSLGAVGALIGPLLVGSLIKAASFDTSYWALVLIAMAAAVLCYLLIPKKYARI